MKYVLTFVCPCIANIVVNDDQQDATVFWLVYLFLISSTCFGRSLRPSSGAPDFIYSLWYCLPMISISSVTPAGSNIRGQYQKL